jgi:hypothetical protein
LTDLEVSSGLFDYFLFPFAPFLAGSGFLSVLAGSVSVFELCRVILVGFEVSALDSASFAASSLAVAFF